MKLSGWLIAGIALAASLPAEDNQAWGTNQEGSHIEFAVHATGDSFVGHLLHWEARFQAEKDGFPQTGALTFPLTELKTGKADRDQQMLTWLEANRFPVATFVIRRVMPANGEFEVSGDFSFHGITRPMSFPVRFGQKDGHRTMDGSAPLDYRDWNLKVFHKFGLLRVDSLVKVTFHFEAAGS